MTPKKVVTVKGKKRLPSVRIYFGGKNSSLGKKLHAVAKEHGMSASMVGVLAIRLGLPLVKRNLEGLLIDIESQAEDHEKRDGVFLNR